MFPSMKGTIGVSDLPDVSVDADASDIFSNLKLGAMLNAEASKNGWVIGTDLLFMKLAQDTRIGPLISEGSVTVKEFAWETSLLRQLTPWLAAGVGGRLVKLTTDIELETNNLNREASATESWYDPILIVRIKNPGASPEQPVYYQLRGDIGGFGIGSEITWQIQAYLGYRFSELFQLSAGYRIIGIDYETGSGENRFKYDIDTSGPVLRLGFNL